MDLTEKKTPLEPRHLNGRPVRIALVDDHPLLLAGLSHELEKHPGLTVAGTTQNSTELVALLNKHPVDVVVSDYTMPGGDYGDGMALFGFLKRRFPGIRLIVVTMMSNPAIIRSLVAQGIHCILSKADSLVYIAGGVYAVLANKHYYSPSIEAIVKMHGIDDNATATSAKNLTIRELEVVRLFVSGLTITEIAERLHRSKQTISTQKMSAMRRLGIRRDADLIMYGVNANLTSHTVRTDTETLPAYLSDMGDS
ncbi:DNA-binding response regulator [Dyella lipolytica]|uniref:Response regulator transcription factor n=1 Tax=Dyella lipolytica TaxID=1867835 RepID=A0ABW8IS32_9GAMM|nr:response regulator transcription factor [Dyella lipolytica]GLQ46994.1 DNA-binding response regulator [Dyella lipolytica]